MSESIHFKMPCCLKSCCSSFVGQKIIDRIRQDDFSLECVPKKIIFLFLNQNICYGYSIEPSQ